MWNRLIFCVSLLAPLVHAGEKELSLIVVAGDENALGAPLAHKGQVYTTQMDRSIPYVYSVKLRDKEKWFSSAAPRSLGAIKANSEKFYMGPELTLARNLKIETGNNWGVVKVAAQDSSLLTDWLRGMEIDGLSGSLIIKRNHMMASYYMHLLRVCERAIQDLRKQGHNPQIRALVWMNGHRDAWEFSKAMSYQKALDKLMDMWREDFGFNMPIIVTQSSFMGHRKPASFKNIMESKVKAVKKDFFSEIIPTKDLSHRSHHELSKQGHEVLGMRMSYALSPMLQASMKYMPKQLAATKERSAEPKPEKEQKPTKREFFQEDFQLNDFPDLEVY